MLKLCAVLLLGLCLSSWGNAADIGEAIPIDQGWTLHWGDLPFRSEPMLWDFETYDWQPVESPFHLGDKSAYSIVWLRLQELPGSWRDPHIFISSIDLTVQVFQGGKQIYQFGHIDRAGNSIFAGWPWHLFSVDPDAGPLYMRIYSDYPFIGLSGEAVIGEKSDLLHRLYRRALPGILIAGFVFLTGLLSMLVGIIKREHWTAVATGALCINLALMMLAENEFSQLIYFDPLAWRYVAAYSYFLIPAFLAVVVWAWFWREPPKLLGLIFAVSLGFSSGVLALSIFSDFSFVNAYPYFDGLFIVLVLVLLIGCFSRFKAIGLQGALIAFGILAVFISLVVDMLSAHGFVGWIGRTGQWGLVLFALASFGVYLIKDWKQQITLRILTNTLEKQVEERTQALRESQQHLIRLAREDYLTKLLNRRAFTELAVPEIANALRHGRAITLALFDIDFFKQINDNYGHTVGDEVLKRIASAIRKECREGDLICRYGGEEFVVLLHATPVKDAETLVERLRETIKILRIVPDGYAESISVTASFGLVTLKNARMVEQSAEQVLSKLLLEADGIMYRVKTAGRDGMHAIFLDGRDLAQPAKTANQG